MKKRFYTRLLLCVVAALLISANVFAQAPAGAQAATGSLPSLPECDAILYVNARRIINEALPRILPAAEYDKVKTQLDEVKRKAGIDINSFESGVVALRFNKPITAAPDFVFVTRGTFNADALLSLARIGLQGKLREEKYGSKSLSIFKLNEVMGAADAKSLPTGTNDLAAVALDGGTLAVGTVSFVKATIDAEAGQKRANPELVSQAMRDSSALMSIAVNISPGLFSGLLPAELKGNEEIFKIISGIENFYLSAGMNATEFPIAASVRTASAENARTLSGILEMGLRAVGGQITDKNVQGIVDAVKINSDGSEVRALVAIPQETITTLIREANKPKPAAKPESAQPKPAAKAKPAPQRKQSRARKP